jgi:hypothetical protein
MTEKSKPRQRTAAKAPHDDIDLMEATRRIMGRLVTTPVEPHKAIVDRRQATKAKPKLAQRKK